MTPEEITVERLKRRRQIASVRKIPKCPVVIEEFSIDKQQLNVVTLSNKMFYRVHDELYLISMPLYKYRPLARPIAACFGVSRNNGVIRQVYRRRFGGSTHPKELLYDYFSRNT